LERFVAVPSEPAGLYVAWRQLVLSQRVLGVAVHDAKLAAAMMLQGIERILTFNARDFARYPGIVAVTPDQLIALGDKE